MPETIDRFMGAYRFLSNFWPSTFRYGGKQWMTVEHAFQAMKTEDKESREAIRLAQSPGIAKRMGRQVTLRADWEKIKISVMQELLRCKFSDPALQQMLLATGDAILIEGNTWGDTFWGVCNDVGENNLGKLLMAIREIYRTTRCEHCKGEGSVHWNYPDEIGFDPSETSMSGKCPKCGGTGKVKK